MSTASVFLVGSVSAVSEERRRELVTDLRRLALMGADALVERFGERPEEFAAVLSETVVVPVDPPYHQRLRKLREWWEFPERRRALGPHAAGVENIVDFFNPPIVFVPAQIGNDAGCLARSLVQRLMDGLNPGTRFDAGRELLIKMLLIRAYQCGVFTE